MGVTCSLYVEAKTKDSWNLVDPATLEPVNPEEIDEDLFFGDTLTFDHGHDTRQFCNLMGLKEEGRLSLVSLHGSPPDLSDGLRRKVEFESQPFTNSSGGLTTPDATGVSPASWILLDQLLALPWNQTIEVQKMVNPGDAKYFSDPPQLFPKDKMTRKYKDGSTFISYGAEFMSGGVSVRYLLSLKEEYGDFLARVEDLRGSFPASQLRFVYWFNW